MKKDWFLQHDVTARGNVRIMMLMDACGMKGCGIYWMVIECLRVQMKYGSPLILLKTLSKQIRVYYQKMLHIVEDFGLFKVRKGPSLPPGLVQSMRQLDEKPERFTLNTRKEDIAKTLKISTTSLSRASAVQYRVVQSSIVQYSIDKSSVVEEDLSATTGAETHCNEKSWYVSSDWETYLGRLPAEWTWMETTAMHSKSHVCSRGMETEALVRPRIRPLCHFANRRLQAVKEGKRNFNERMADRLLVKAEGLFCLLVCNVLLACFVIFARLLIIFWSLGKKSPKE